MNIIGWILLYLICGVINSIITWKLYGDRDMKEIEEAVGTTKGWDCFYTIGLILFWPFRVITNIIDFDRKEES